MLVGTPIGFPKESGIAFWKSSISSKGGPGLLLPLLGLQTKPLRRSSVCHDPLTYPVRTVLLLIIFGMADMLR